MEPELKNKTMILALMTVGAILVTIAVIAIVMHLTGIMAQAPFIDNLWWAKGAAIAGLVLWETGTIVTKMEQQKLSRRNGIIGIVLMALAALTAAVFFIIGIGKWLFYLSFAFFFVGSIITTGNEDEPSVAQ